MPGAEERLVAVYGLMATAIAKTYRGQALRDDIAFENLVLAGQSGLLAAAARFDPTRPFRFSTYATHWIRQEIGRAIDGG